MKSITKKYRRNKSVKDNRKNKLHGHYKGKIGLILNIVDKNNHILSIGDEITYKGNNGYLLYNMDCEKYGIFLSNSMWYGDDKFNPNSYGKFIPIPMDNGGKMDIELII